MIDNLRYETKKIKNRTKKITFFGDSITAHEEMYVTKFLNLYNGGNNTKSNWAIGGATVMHIPTATSYWGDQIVFSKNDNPFLNIVLIGVNDPLDYFFPIEYQRNMRLIKEFHPSSNIVCMGILEYNRPANYYRNEKNNWIQDVCQKEKIRYLDTTGWINPILDTYDGVHPNSVGSTKIANRLFNEIGV